MSEGAAIPVPTLYRVVVSSKLQQQLLCLMIDVLLTNLFVRRTLCRSCVTNLVGLYALAARLCMAEMRNCQNPGGF